MVIFPGRFMGAIVSVSHDLMVKMYGTQSPLL
jgi:hypothetical protein